MSVQDVVIRAARADDADAMGRLHVRAWQHAYRGVMPDEYLDGLRADDRVAMWRDAIARTGGRGIVVAASGDLVVGFAAFGGERAEDPTPSCGELYAVNLDPDHWGRGIGRALVRHVTQALVDMGFEEAVLWVVPENTRARALYESEGWTPDGASTTEEMFGVTVTDIRYRRPLTHVSPSGPV